MTLDVRDPIIAAFDAFNTGVITQGTYFPNYKSLPLPYKGLINAIQLGGVAVSATTPALTPGITSLEKFQFIAQLGAGVLTTQAMAVMGVAAIGTPFVVGAAVSVAIYSTTTYLYNNKEWFRDFVDDFDTATTEAMLQTGEFFERLGMAIGDTLNEIDDYIDQTDWEGMVGDLGENIADRLQSWGNTIDSGFGDDLIDAIAGLDDSVEALWDKYVADGDYEATVNDLLAINPAGLTIKALLMGYDVVSEVFDSFLAWAEGGWYSPLLVNIDGYGVRDSLLSKEDGVFFDIDADGFAERIGWTGAGNAFVVRDLNANGVVDSQVELFYTDDTQDAFVMLAEYDDTLNGGNADGRFDSLDGGWGDIQLWVDYNGNGYSEADELFSPEDLGVYGFDLTRQIYGSSANGNRIDGRASWLDEYGDVGGEYADVFFDTDQHNSWYTGNDLTSLPDVSIEALTMPLSRGYGTLPALHYALTENEDLMEMMEDFVAIDFATDTTSINQMVHEMIVEWAGAGDVAYDDYHDHFDSQLIAVYAELMNVPHTDVQERGAWQPYVRWMPIFNELKARMLVQGPMAEIFAGSYYDFSTDSLVLAGELEDILDAAELAAPVDPMQNRIFWSEIGNILASRSSQFDLTKSEMLDEIALVAGHEVTVYEGYIQILTESSYQYRTNNINDFILGNEENQRLDGMNGDDLIFGGGGSDRLEGWDGDDIIYAGVGASSSWGGYGNDTIYTEGGNHSVYGGAGDDTVHAGDGNNHIDGGAGANVIEAGNGHNKVYGGTGAAEVAVGDGNNEIRLGAGADVASAGDGNNTIYGGDGNDTLAGGNGDNIIKGDGGNDLLSAGDGADSIYGGVGADTLSGGEGDDLLAGGAGSDTYLWAEGDGNDVIDDDGNADSSADVLWLTGGIVAAEVSVSGGSDKSLVLEYTPTGETITLHNYFKYEGNVIETIRFDDASTLNVGVGLVWHGTENRDQMYGTAYNDTIIGGKGNDGLYGGAGDDTYHFHIGDGRDIVSDAVGQNTAVFYGMAASDFTIQSYGSSYYMTYKGDGSTIAFSGYNASNWTISYQAISSVSGTLLDDVLYDTAGNTTLTGGGGNDVFVFMSRASADVITDFTSGDKIDLSSASFGGINYAGLSISDVSGDALIDLGGGQTIILSGYDYTNLSSSDFIFEITSSLVSTLGTLGDDTISTGSANDEIEGMGGNDSISAGNGNNIIYAGDGNDTISAGYNNDLIYAGDGANSIAAGGGVDTVYAGDGNDTISGSGTLIVYAGDGDDTLSISGLSGTSFFDLGGGENSFSYSSGFSSSRSAKIITGDEGDDITFTGGHATIYGGLGADSIVTGNGDDFVESGDGNDTITAGSGANTVYAGAGDDVINVTSGAIYAEDGNDVIDVYGNVSIEAGDGDDSITIYGASAGLSLIDLGAGQNILANSGSGFNSSHFAHIIAGGQGDTITYSRGHATVDGGAGADNITTGSGNDYIESREGNDTISSGGGSDTIYSGAGDDVISMSGGIVYADDGADTITASGSLGIYAGDGDDEVIINGTITGDSIIDLGTGVNILSNSGSGFTHSHKTQIYAGDEGDDITFIRTDVTVYGGLGDDTILTGVGSDVVYTDEGNNAVTVGGSANTVYGGDGNDTISASGSLVFYGAGGDDLVQFGSATGSSYIELGTGVNVLTHSGIGFSSSTYATITGGDQGNDIEFEKGHADITVGDGDDLIITGSGNDYIYAGEGENTVSAAGGSDTVYSGAGDDVVSVTSGPSYLYLGDGNNAISAGGVIHLYVGDGNDSLTISGGSTGDSIINMGEGDNIIQTTVSGSTSNASAEIFTGSGEDSITFTYAAATIHSGAGDDTIVTGVRADMLYGEAGDDSISAGSGNDTIIGGHGQDTLTGGSGNDRFKFTDISDSTDLLRDVITDFAKNYDKIDLSGLGFTGVQAGAASGSILGYTSSGGVTVIEADGSNFEIELTGAYTLAGGDFIF